MTGVGRIQVVVQDANDHVPSFPSDRYLVHVAENQQVGTKVLEVHATDEDEGNNGLVRFVEWKFCLVTV